MSNIDRRILANIVGLALGDGNLSNPNGRATRLRITCDLRYKGLLSRITSAIQSLLPKNKVSIVNRPGENCVDLSCYSNKWENWLGWKVGKGSKFRQQVSIPAWIQNNRDFTIPCLRGLIESDGCIYLDRGYRMVNFTTMIPKLANDVFALITQLGFKAHFYEVKRKPHPKYVVRVSKNTDQFIKKLSLLKN